MAFRRPGDLNASQTFIHIYLNVQWHFGREGDICV